MWFASDSTDATASVTGVFLQFGVLGAFALLALWFFLNVYKREVARADRAEAALAVLNSDVRDKVIPALTDTIRVNAELQQLLRDRRAND
jgi:hypothetical protein